MVKEIFHTWEQITVIGHSHNYQAAVTESTGNSFCHVVPGQIEYPYIFSSVFLQQLGHSSGCVACISMDRSIGNHYPFFFGFVAAPGKIFADIMSQVFFQYRSVERADHLDIQCSGFL